MFVADLLLACVAFFAIFLLVNESLTLYVDYRRIKRMKRLDRAREVMSHPFKMRTYQRLVHHSFPDPEQYLDFELMRSVGAALGPIPRSSADIDAALSTDMGDYLGD